MGKQMSLRGPYTLVTFACETRCEIFIDFITLSPLVWATNSNMFPSIVNS